MAKKKDKETRYFIDLDLKAQKLIHWDYDQRNSLSQELPNPSHHRIFLTKGQYHKLEEHLKRLNFSPKK